MTRRQPPATRRKAILDAAASLLVANGLAGTSVDAVAQRAGIAKGTVYLYFESRSDLLAALRSRYAEGLADRARSILEHADPADPGSVTDTFERLAAELLDYVHAHQRLSTSCSTRPQDTRNRPGSRCGTSSPACSARRWTRARSPPPTPACWPGFSWTGCTGRCCPWPTTTSRACRPASAKSSAASSPRPARQRT